MTWQELVQQEKAEALLMAALEATPMEHGILYDGDVLLECGCVKHFDIAKPHKKERLWCARHRSEQSIKALGYGKAFRTKCETCKYTRSQGGRLAADTAAVRHRERKRHHVVHILDTAGTIVYTFKDDAGVTTLPDLPPF